MEQRASIVLRIAALVALLLGALLVLGTWDGLWRELDLPQPQPAMYAQVGGGGLLGLAFVLWSAPARPEAVGPIANGAALAFALGAGIIAAWLITEDVERDLGIDTLGTVLVIIDAVVLAVVAFALARVGRR